MCIRDRDIPQSMDCITFGTADRIRQSAPRAVFLLGAVQGEFPMIPAQGGVFSDAERRRLLALELPLSDALEDRMLEEEFLAYSAMCSASERLYVTYPTSVGREAKSPGPLVSAAVSYTHLDVYKRQGQWSALPPSHTTTMRSRIAGFIKMAEATFVIAPIAMTYSGFSGVYRMARSARSRAADEGTGVSSSCR